MHNSPGGHGRTCRLLISESKCDCSWRSDSVLRFTSACKHQAINIVASIALPAPTKHCTQVVLC